MEAIKDGLLSPYFSNFMYIEVGDGSYENDKKIIEGNILFIPRFSSYSFFMYNLLGDRETVFSPVLQTNKDWYMLQFSSFPRFDSYLLYLMELYGMGVESWILAGIRHLAFCSEVLETVDRVSAILSLLFTRLSSH
jgi:hypothetical protein